MTALAMAAVLHVGDINARALAYAAWAFATLGRSVDQLLKAFVRTAEQRVGGSSAGSGQRAMGVCSTGPVR